MAALTEQPDYEKVRNCWKWLKNKLIAEGRQLATNCSQLKVPAAEGKKYLTDVADTEQMLWLIQFILSKRAELLVTAHREGHAWADMAILCRHHSEMDMCAEFLRKRKLPHQLRRNSSSVFDPAHDSIKLMTLHVSKGLEFPVVALVGAGRMPAEGEDEREEARLFYVGATRATQRLVIGASGNWNFSAQLKAKRQDLIPMYAG